MRYPVIGGHLIAPSRLTCGVAGEELDGVADDFRLGLPSLLGKAAQ
jgi:hypothetical protein